MSSSRYLLDNQDPEAGSRFAALSALFNPWTFQRFEALGVAAGWRCWEVGAGGASVPLWLADRTGPSGYVLATDIDTSWLEGRTGDLVDVRVHDVATDPPPAEGLDLVHARLVLVHLPERDRALRSLVEALRPGGWLLLEDADPALQSLACLDERGPAERLANKLKAAFRVLLVERGVELAYGRRLPALLREAGLVDVQAAAYFPIGGPASDALELATTRQVRQQLLEHGLATEAEVDQHVANVTAGTLDLVTSPMISAWGRKPASS